MTHLTRDSRNLPMRTPHEGFTESRVNASNASYELVAPNGASPATSPMLLNRQQLVDAQAVADALSVSRAFVYEHADELGAIRLGNGPRARLRFDLERAIACVAGRKSDAPEPAQEARSRTRRRRSNGHKVELLPIRGQIRGENTREAA